MHCPLHFVTSREICWLNKHLVIVVGIDPLHVMSHFGHFHIRPFGRRHVGGQKCIAVIERKALNVSLFTNASDYSNKIRLAWKVYVLVSYKYCSFAEVVTCVGEQRYD